MLEISGLTKRFADVLALDGVSFNIKKGEVFGFLGANGAGKTTTMRIVLGLLRADAGTVVWEGKPAGEWPRLTWGYMPEDRGLYLRMPVAEQLAFFASLYGVPRRKATTDAMTWLARFRISDYADRKAETLSKGNQQKVQYIATVLHDPDVLLMDEPFSGLDPVNASLLKSAFLEMRNQGKTIIFSTHQLDQAEELCDSVAIIDRGRIITSGPTREVKRSAGHQVVRLATSDDRMAANGDGKWLHELPNVTVTREGIDYTELRVDAGADPQRILDAAMHGHGEVLRFEVADPSLEDIFVQLVGRGASDTEEQTLAPVGEGRA
jgi:ABC-2 type transport system ATP-binding protein